jgi:hypothetical protein
LGAIMGKLPKTVRKRLEELDAIVFSEYNPNRLRTYVKKWWPKSDPFYVAVMQRSDESLLADYLSLREMKKEYYISSGQHKRLEGLIARYGAKKDPNLN